jgi:ankyrin repeat protein
MEHIRTLLCASEEGDIATVTYVLDHGTDVNACDSDFTTALQVSSANGHEHIVRFLIMRGATLDLANSMGWTPLLLASRHGHVNVVSLLLQNRADINAETKLGANALTLASRGGHLQICKLLIESGIDLSPSTAIGTATCEFTALMAAAHHGHDTVVRYLIDHRFDVNYRTPSIGMNALMLAALNGHLATSQILIERGADPNLTNVNNATPFQISTISKKRELAGYLERKTTNKPKEGICGSPYVELTDIYTY